MKKKMITRSLLGFPIGIAIGYFITILGSLAWANGDYSPCAPELTAAIHRHRLISHFTISTKIMFYLFLNLGGSNRNFTKVDTEPII